VKQPFRRQGDDGGHALTVGCRAPHDAGSSADPATMDYRLKYHATIAGKEDKNKKVKSKPDEPSTAEPAS